MPLSDEESLLCSKALVPVVHPKPARMTRLTFMPSAATGWSVVEVQIRRDHSVSIAMSDGGLDAKRASE